jgi:hypothetical protein
MDEPRRPRFPATESERTIISTRTASGGSPRPGTILGHTYRIEAQLPGRGMGEMYRARHIELGTAHAVKVILPTAAGNPRMVELLVEEARRLGRVRHPAVVSYEGLFRDEQGLRFLVMEFVEGEPLSALIARRRLEPDEVLRLRDRLGAGLAEVHSRGVIHRNISPDAIVLPDGDVSRAKLIDFGIAKSADPSEATLIGGDLVAKAAYASPEQLGLFGGRVDSRSDIYSLGLVLAAAAIGFGKTLDMGTTPATLIASRQRVPDLSAVPAELRAAIAPMLAPAPADRPPSMQALLDASHGRAVPAQPTSNRGWATIGAAALAALVVAAGVGFGVYRLAFPAASPEELKAKLAAVAAGYQCASLRFDLAANRSAQVAGRVVSAAELERLRGEVGAIRGIGATTFDVSVLGPPHCQVVGLLSPLAERTQREAPTIAFASKTAEAHLGERLDLDVKAPGFDGYLYIDYYDRGGQVLHLFPNDRDFFNFRPARNHFLVFKPPLSSCWAFNGNTGQELIALIATAKPLFPARRAEIEEIGDYLAQVGPALAALPQRDQAAALLMFNLREAAPWLVQGGACPSG